MSSENEIAHNVMKSVLDRTHAYFTDALNVAIASELSRDGEIDDLTLRSITSIMGLSGNVNLLVAFSFDRSLASHIYDLESKSIRVEHGEEHVLLLDMAAEILNTVLGHCTEDLAEDGSNVLLSAPVVIEEARRLHRPKEAAFHSTTLETMHGKIDINFIAPKHLFDSELNTVAGSRNQS